MRRSASQTAAIAALGLLPAFALAGLGWQATSALTAELRRTARDEALRVAQDVATALPTAIDAELARARAALLAVAGEVAARLPFEPPGRVLARAEAVLGDGALEVEVGGAALAPRGPCAVDAAFLPEWDRYRAALAATARQQRDALQLATALRTPLLRARALAMLRERASADVDAALQHLDGSTVAAAGPAVIEALLASAAGRARLLELERDGWLAAVPATPAARADWLAAIAAPAAAATAQRLRADADRGATVVAVIVPLPGGATLRWLRRPAEVLPAVRLPKTTDVCAVTLTPAVAMAPTHWVDDATAALTLEAGPLGAVALAVQHTGLGAVEAAAANRHWLYGGGIALLLLATVSGAWLTRRALASERAAARLRDDFLANVSHELKTPLTSLRLHAEMLGDPALDAAVRARYLAVAVAEGSRLSALVEDLLDFAALQRGKRRLEPEPVDLAAAARSLAAGWQPQCARDGVQLRCEGDSVEVPAMADPVALARIVTNLLQNALRHGRPARDGTASCVRLRLGPGPRLEVRDNGPGVPTELRERIFERFERARRGGQGIGLGLALSRELARAMGGELTCGDDGGETVFALALPAVPADVDSTGAGGTELEASA